MKKVLITGAGSYVGESVKKYILSTSTDFEIDSVDTMSDAWKQTKKINFAENLVETKQI